jgi:hypothetical protein
VMPRQGHLDGLKRIYGFLKKHPDGAIWFRTGIPDHEAIKMPETYDWAYLVHGEQHEDLPRNLPIPRGLPVMITTYEDANLMHDLLTGRSVTGCIHFVNQTPVYWFSMKQNSVETATYGSEFVAARLATEQIMDLNYTLRSLDVPIDGPAWMFEDNQSVITSSTIPHSSLNKRHNVLSYHRVREAISSKVMYFLHVTRVYNPVDVLTKALPWITFWPLVQQLLFWKGERVNAKRTTPISDIRDYEGRQIAEDSCDSATRSGKRKPSPSGPSVSSKSCGTSF